MARRTAELSVVATLSTKGFQAGLKAMEAETVKSRKRIARDVERFDRQYDRQQAGFAKAAKAYRYDDSDLAGARRNRFLGGLQSEMDRMGTRAPGGGGAGAFDVNGAIATYVKLGLAAKFAAHVMDVFTLSVQKGGAGFMEGLRALPYGMGTVISSVEGLVGALTGYTGSVEQLRKRNEEADAQQALSMTSYEAGKNVTKNLKQDTLKFLSEQTLERGGIGLTGEKAALHGAFRQQMGAMGNLSRDRKSAEEAAAAALKLGAGDPNARARYNDQMLQIDAAFVERRKQLEITYEQNVSNIKQEFANERAKKQYERELRESEKRVALEKRIDEAIEDARVGGNIQAFRKAGDESMAVAAEVDAKWKPIVEAAYATGDFGKYEAAINKAKAREVRGRMADWAWSGDTTSFNSAYNVRGMATTRMDKQPIEADPKEIDLLKQLVAEAKKRPVAVAA